MVYLFYGEDSYRLNKQVSLILAKYTNELGFYVFDFDLSQEQKDMEAADVLKNENIFLEKKVIILRNLSLYRDWKALGELLEKKSADKFALIILKEDKKFSAKDKFLNYFSKFSTVKSFMPLEDQALALWIKKYAQSSGVGLNRSDISYLVSCCGSDLYAISGILDKISLDPEIKEKNISNALKENLRSDVNIWELAKEIFGRNKFKAADDFYMFLGGGGKGDYLFNLLATYLKNAVLYNKEDISWINKKTKMLSNLDLLVKTGKLDSMQAVELVLGDVFD